MPGQANPITTYFARAEQKKKKENLRPKKRKYNAANAVEIEYQPPGSSKKTKLADSSRQQFTYRTRSLNKEEFDAAASSTSTPQASTVPRRTAPHHQYITPKSLAKPSSTRLYDNDCNETIDLTQIPPDVNPFIVQNLQPRDFSLKTSESRLPATPSSSLRTLTVTHPSASPSIRRQVHGIPPTTPQRSRWVDLVSETPGTPGFISPKPRPKSVMFDALPNLSHVPSSQSQEVDIDFSTYRRCGARSDSSSDEVIPGSQSQDFDDGGALLQVISPRRQRVRRELELAKEVAAAAETGSRDSAIPSSQSQEFDSDGGLLHIISPRRKRVMHHFEQFKLAKQVEVEAASQDILIPSSQSQEFDSDGTLLNVVSPRRKRIMHEFEQARRIAASTEVVLGSQSQIEHEIADIEINQTANLQLELGPSQLEDDPADGDTTVCDTGNAPLGSVLDDHDIQSLFESDMRFDEDRANALESDVYQVDTMRVDPARLLTSDAASSVTESDSDDEQWMKQAQVAREPSANLPHDLPYASQMQSWNTDVSAYSFPTAALDFFDMLEQGPD
ncbi:hypothetical protein BDP27DRAFT_1313425 [Rhodocollybia butyracea]|uniref:Uncharacterized protein n=1 Tax=Rhodocollybia butyracea TaxID=206335 RepID=A0A9P5Q6R9_9AGAR|nr:hypothetical protein BDP27DRAFT_1313425 [Rhodocollybia butyracea]